MQDPVIPKDLFENLFKICAIEKPAPDDFASLHKDICDIVKFIDSSLKHIEIEEGLVDKEKNYNRLRTSDFVETQPQIKNMAPQIVSGLFCVPGIRTVEE